METPPGAGQRPSRRPSPPALLALVFGVEAAFIVGGAAVGHATSLGVLGGILLGGLGMALLIGAFWLLIGSVALSQELTHDEGSTMSETEEYFFCLVHHRVEQRNQGCPAKDRLGPYPSEAEASRALEKVKERNEEWDNDPNWKDKP